LKNIDLESISQAVVSEESVSVEPGFAAKGSGQVWENLSKLGFFLLGLGVLLLGLEISARKIFYAPQKGTGDSIRTSMVDSIRREEIEILSFGNSHAVRAFDPHFFSRRAFNFAGSGQDVYYDFKLWDKYGDQFPNVKYLIISLDYFSFGYDITTVERYRIQEYIGKGIFPHRPYLLLYGWLQSKSYLATYRTVLMKMLVGHLRGGALRYEGGLARPAYKPKDAFRFSEFSAKERSFNGRFRADFFMKTSYVKENEKSYLGYLKKMIDMALARHAKVLLVTLPTNPEYYRRLTGEFVMNFRMLLETLLASYAQNPNVQYIDLTGDKRFDSDDFFDVDHLHRQGAEKLTKLLDTEIYRLWEKGIQANS
jgi:hypothetical protein